MVKVYETAKKKVIELMTEDGYNISSEYVCTGIKVVVVLGCLNDYKIEFILLFFSLLHVFMELPLNIISIRALGMPILKIPTSKYFIGSFTLKK